MSETASPAIRIVLADKSPLVIAGIRALLEKASYDLAACVADGRSFIDLVRKERFDVAVIGWELPGADGKSILEELRDIPGAPPVIVYTGTTGASLARQIMELGGAGFVSKSSPPELLISTIAQVADKRMVFPLMDVRKINRDVVATLTKRESSMLAALASGATNAELAQHFEVSLHTIKFHLKNLYNKLEVANRTQAAILYMKSLNDRE